MEIPHERFQYLLQTNVLPSDAERAACIEELVACQKALNANNKIYSVDRDIIVLQQLNELVVVSALCNNDRQRLRTARLSLIASHLLFYQDQQSAEHLEILDVSRGFRVLDRFTAPNLHYLYISDVPSASLVTSPALMLLNFIHRSNPIILSLSLVSVALTETDVSCILSMLYELDDLTLYDLGWCPCKLLTHHPQTGSWNPSLTKLSIPLCPDAVAMVDSRSHDDYNKNLKFPVRRLRYVEFKAPYPDGAVNLVERMSGALGRGVRITGGPYEEHGVGSTVMVDGSDG